MPSPQIEAFAKKSGKSVAKVEEIFKKGKELAREKGLEGDRMFAFAVGVVKRALGLDESVSFKEMMDAQEENNG